MSLFTKFSGLFLIALAFPLNASVVSDDSNQVVEIDSATVDSLTDCTLTWSDCLNDDETIEGGKESLHEHFRRGINDLKTTYDPIRSRREAETNQCKKPGFEVRSCEEHKEYRSCCLDTDVDVGLKPDSNEDNAGVQTTAGVMAVGISSLILASL
eukprot:Awhi_evm1s4396